MATPQQVGSVKYEKVDAGYFARRQLRRYAGVWSLWLFLPNPPKR